MNNASNENPSGNPIDQSQTPHAEDDSVGNDACLPSQDEAEGHMGRGSSRPLILFGLMFLMAGMMLKCFGATGPAGSLLFLLLDITGLGLIVFSVWKKRPGRRRRR